MKIEPAVREHSNGTESRIFRHTMQYMNKDKYYVTICCGQETSCDRRCVKLVGGCVLIVAILSISVVFLFLNKHVQFFIGAFSACMGFVLTFLREETEKRDGDDEARHDDLVERINNNMRNRLMSQFPSPANSRRPSANVNGHAKDEKE